MWRIVHLSYTFKGKNGKRRGGEEREERGRRGGLCI